jgi:hypothetical protein
LSRAQAHVRTVSVKYVNGSTFDAAKVEAEPAYASMLAKWSLISSQDLAQVTGIATHQQRSDAERPRPPYNDYGEQDRDLPRQRHRRERKAKGLPASEDVSTPSKTLRALRDAAEWHVGQNIDSVLAAAPNLVALYLEDIEDSFEYVGLESLDNDNMLLRLFHETIAAAASNGIGLCRSEADAASCKAENKRWLKDTSSPLCTPGMRCVERILMQSVYRDFPFAADPPSMDFTLGSDEVQSNPDEEYYWQAVKDTIWRGVLADNYAPYWPSEIFLLGESARDPKFRAVLEEALIATMDDLPEIFDDHAVFQTVRVAAEIARRGGYFMLWPDERTFNSD